MKTLPINQIINGETLEVLKTFPNASIDCILTSPPYNCNISYDSYTDRLNLTDYKAMMKGILSECYRTLKDGGRILINVPFACKIETENSSAYAFHSVIFTEICDSIGFKQFDILTWYKSRNNPADALVGNTAWGSWQSPSCPRLRAFCEAVLVFYKGSEQYKGSGGNTDITAEEFKLATRNAVFIDSHNEIVTYDSIVLAPAETKQMRTRKHPAPFPEALVARLLKLYTYQNDIVVDIFNGSGTTTSVCRKLNRRYIGIDLSPEYCKVAKNRLREFYTEIEEE